MKYTRLGATVVAGAFLMGGLAACSSSADKADGQDSKGKVYLLNWKPEQKDAFEKIAKEYTKKTGVPVKVTLAASGDYEQTLKTVIDKKDAPTIFQVNGPVGLDRWKSYISDLTDSKLAKELKDPSLALKGEGDKVYGVPAAVEGYGLIYNDAILNKYFALSGAKAKSVAEINNFAKLKEVADDMQAKKDELGIKGVFASTSLKPGEDWRWQTHLSNIPIYYEFQDSKVNDLKDLKFKYANEFKQLFDLFLTDSVVDKGLTPSKAVADSMGEFARGEVAMVQNGMWAWDDIQKAGKVKADEVKFMPLYTGHEGEEKQGLCVGTEAFMAINSKASDADKKASQEFLEWLFLSDEGKKYVVEDLKFLAPFKNYTDADTPDNPLAKAVQASLASKDTQVIPWIFQVYPGQKFKDDFGAGLGQYASGNKTWEDVVKIVVDGWAADHK